MFEKFICIEVKNGNCKKTCSHSEPHEFDKEYCCQDVCSDVDTNVNCVEISMENYI